MPPDYPESMRFLDGLRDMERGDRPEGNLDDYIPRMKALLECLGNPHDGLSRAIVGGTNGKGTVTQLAAEILVAHGLCVGTYTSPHLHTIRERIQINRLPATTDMWAEGMAHIMVCADGFADKGFGMFSKFEAVTALAALLFWEQEVDAAIFEVGLGGTYDATNAFDCPLAALASIGRDHVEMLGELPSIIEDKVGIGRPGRPLLVSTLQPPEVLEAVRGLAAKHGFDLNMAGLPDSKTAADAPSPTTSPPAVDEDIFAGRPATFVANARLSITLAARLAPRGLDASIVEATIREHTRGGRFEVYAESPFLILDGAHNEPAAQALAGELASRAPKWLHVVGVGHGHDAAGILSALAQTAEHIILTSSGDLRARSPKSLGQLVPDGSPYTVASSLQEATQAAMAQHGEGQHVCVSGSLHLVARVREVLGTSHESDDISDGHLLESLACVEAAAASLGLDSQRRDEFGHLLHVTDGQEQRFFIRNGHPFNRATHGAIATDKGYQYDLFSGTEVPVPMSVQLFNPWAPNRFARYKSGATPEEMAEQAAESVGFPCVIKPVRGAFARRIKRIHDCDALAQAIRQHFGSTGKYDNIVLVQEALAGPEYRLVASRGELLLAYKREGTVPSEAVDLNPLHQEDGHAKPIHDEETLTVFADLAKMMESVLPMGLCGIDVIVHEGKPYVLEVNEKPACYYYNRDNGRDDFIGIYRKLLVREFQLGTPGELS